MCGYEVRRASKSSLKAFVKLEGESSKNVRKISKIRSHIENFPVAAWEMTFARLKLSPIAGPGFFFCATALDNHADSRRHASVRLSSPISWANMVSMRILKAVFDILETRPQYSFISS